MSLYRKNVGLVILKNKKIFIGHRIDVPINSNDGWQMPQGGIDDNENIVSASYREIFEEAGIQKEKLQFISQMPTSIKYDFPEKVLKKNKTTKWEKYKGQEQFWLAFNFTGTNEDINLHPTTEPQEFSTWKWEKEDFIMSNIVDFKKNVYKLVFTWLRENKLL